MQGGGISNCGGARGSKNAAKAQQIKKTRRGCRVIINGGARRKEMINMEVYEIKKKWCMW